VCEERYTVYSVRDNVCEWRYEPTHTHTHTLSTSLAPLLRQSLQGFVLLALIVLADQSEKHALKPIISSKGNLSFGWRGGGLSTLCCLFETWLLQKHPWLWTTFPGDEWENQLGGEKRLVLSVHAKTNSFSVMEAIATSCGSYLMFKCQLCGAIWGRTASVSLPSHSDIPLFITSSFQDVILRTFCLICYYVRPSLTIMCWRHRTARLFL